MANNCDNEIKITGSKNCINLLGTLLKNNDYGYLSDVFQVENPGWFDMHVTVSEDTISIGGDSSWKPPLAFFTAVSKKYPDIQIYCTYSEMGNNFAGYANIVNGICDDNLFSYWEGLAIIDYEYYLQHLKEEISFLSENDADFELYNFEGIQYLKEEDKKEALLKEWGS